LPNIRNAKGAIRAGFGERSVFVVEVPPIALAVVDDLIYFLQHLLFIQMY